MNMTTPFTLPSCTPPRAYTPSPCSCQRCKKDNQCRFNGKTLRDLEKPVARVTAVHTGANARRASADTAEGLETDLYLAKGANVMLTKNLYQQVGLVNVIRGEVVCR